MIYLNNAATTFPKPGEVIKAVNQVLSEIPEQQKRGFSGDGDFTLDRCREIAANFFGVSDRENIIFNSGATESLNTLIFGITGKGQKVVSTVTEHNSVLRPLFHLQDGKKIALELIGCDEDGYIDLDELCSGIKAGPCTVVINHVSNVTGAVQNLEEIINICDKPGVKLIIDASQSAGHIPVGTFGAPNTAVVFTGHKGLFGIQGSGGFYLPPGIQCRPMLFGGTGSRSDLRGQPEDLPAHLEAGTRGLPGAVSIAAGMKWISNRGPDNISRHESRLGTLLMQELSAIKSVRVYSSGKSRSPSGVLSFNMENFSSNEVSFILEKSFGIITRAGLHCSPLIHKAIGTYPDGTVRISFSVFNTDDDIFKLVDAVKMIAESGAKF